MKVNGGYPAGDTARKARKRAMKSDIEYWRQR